ncbi:unnamed protein product [Paramecium sonneborni]|uniref:RNA-dependent RNA polymerase n=1 Tax=Paramecium sonneborni TaxID=65129 RepID=A0A8S1JS04_9CILI|nr:unnamed protein product [Paramecium sonneborni]
MKLLYHNELQYVFQFIRNTKFDILTQELNKSQLNFEQKYNFICLITENRINDSHHLKSILISIGKHLKNNDEQQNNAILDQTFQQFMRFSENLRNSIRISDLNNRNLSIFKRELKTSISRFQENNKYNKPILIKNIKLTPTGFVPMIRSFEKAKLIINLFDYQKFLKVIIYDDDGNQIDKNKSMTGQLIKVKLKEGIELFKEKFQLLGWNYTELRQDIFWMIKEDQKDSNFLLSKFKYGFSILKNLTQSRQNFGNFFLNGQQMEFKQVVIEHNDQISKQSNHFGQISRNLISMIREKLNNKEISVIQIIFDGIQYILQLNNKLKDDRIQLDLSNTKLYDFNSIISVIDYNKLRGANLNSRIIEILIENGIKETVFVELLQWHLKQIQIQQIQRILSLDQKSELYGILPIIEIMNIMKNNYLDENNSLFMKKVCQKLKLLEIQQIKSKLFGVVDNYGILNDGGNKLYQNGDQKQYVQVNQQINCVIQKESQQQQVIVFWVRK